MASGRQVRRRSFAERVDHRGSDSGSECRRAKGRCEMKETWIEKTTEQVQGTLWRWPDNPGAPGAILEGACIGRRIVGTRFGERTIYDFRCPDGRVVGLFATGRLDRLLAALLDELGNGTVLRVTFLRWVEAGSGRRREFSVAYRAE